MTTKLRIALLASTALICSGSMSTLMAQDSTPSETETPAVEAPAADAPAAETPATDAPASADSQPADADTQPAADPNADTTLPEVEVIQEQPEPQPEPEPQTATQEPAPDPQPVSQPDPVDDGIDPLPDDEIADAAPVDVPQSLTEAEARASGDFVPVSPIGGAVVEYSKVPSATHTTSSEDFQKRGQIEAQQVLQQAVPGVIVNDAAGSTFRSQVEFRGFSTGSLTGFPQGLSVYQNGARINEVFGDTVFFDLIPSNAINDITLVTGNPVYGLNAVGGALSVLMKDGFTFQGTEIDMQAGSFGRRQIGVQHGSQVGNWAGYAAYEKIIDDGYRDFSEVEIDRFYGDIGYKSSKFEAHFNITLAESTAGVVAATPIELLNINRDLTFTSPQTTEVDLFMPQINAKVKATRTLTLSGLAYYRRFRSNVVDGNLFEGEECGEVAEEALEDQLGRDPTQAEIDAFLLASNVDDDQLCSEEIENGELEALEDRNGNIVTEDDVEDAAGDGPLGVIDRIQQRAESWGGTVQAVEKGDLFGLKNQFVAGVTYDRGQVNYQTSSEVGTIGSRFVVTGSGIILGEPDDFASRNVDVDTEYVGVYLQNVTELTDALTLTLGGRYNYAHVDLLDLTGEFDGITSSHTFEAFNPNVGLTYEFANGFTLYGSYSQANRAPTPGELACANPDNPCPIESFLTDDPPLEQVKSRTFEVGFKGKVRNGDQRFSYGLGYFNTLSEDDILFVTSNTLGRGFFLNAGDTLRQGIEAGGVYEDDTWTVYANYAYVRATFESLNIFSSPANPSANANGEIISRPGDRIPGIPQHRFKAGIAYAVTPQWTVGADLIAASDQFFLGDEGNDQPTLSGYTRVDLNTSYKLNKNVEIYGYINNVFDKEYGLFGTFFEADEAGEVIEDGGVAPITEFTDSRTILPAPPVAAYGGVRIKF